MVTPLNLLGFPTPLVGPAKSLLTTEEVMKQQLLFTIEQIRQDSAANKLGSIFFIIYILFTIFSAAKFEIGFAFAIILVALPISMLIFLSKGKKDFDAETGLQNIDIYVYSGVIEVYSSDKLLHRLLSKETEIVFKSSGALTINKGSQNIFQIPATLTEPGVFSFIWRFTVKRELESLFHKSRGAGSAIVEYFSKGSTLKKVVNLLKEHGYNARMN
jgi:hypothetical protein